VYAWFSWNDAMQLRCSWVCCDQSCMETNNFNVNHTPVSKKLACPWSWYLWAEILANVYCKVQRDDGAVYLVYAACAERVVHWLRTMYRVGGIFQWRLPVIIFFYREWHFTGLTLPVHHRCATVMSRVSFILLLSVDYVSRRDCIMNLYGTYGVCVSRNHQHIRVALNQLIALYLCINVRLNMISVLEV
jgi:hypothetical protein